MVCPTIYLESRHTEPQKNQYVQELARFDTAGLDRSRLLISQIYGLCITSRSMRSLLLLISLIASAATPILVVAENSPPEHGTRTPSHYECGTIPGSVSENECINRRLRVLDVELNKAYQLALASLPKHSDKDSRKEQSQLRRSQLAWLKYKNENCDLVGGLEGDMAQAITFNVLLCREYELKERIRFLRQISDTNEP